MEEERKKGGRLPGEWEDFGGSAGKAELSGRAAEVSVEADVSGKAVEASAGQKPYDGDAVTDPAEENRGDVRGSTEEMPGTGAGLLPRANRNYKDTVFRMLFKEKENLLSLYNAVAGTDYRDAQGLKVVTLENAVYMGMANDIAFLIGTGLYLYEHQSTVNPNMPLRDLLYISSEYQVLLKDKTLYSSALLRIPAPKFFVFYNGKEEIGERTELRLSDSYITPQENPDLELKVTVLNINAGHNKELMEQCRMLREYSLYVARVRKYAAEMKLDGAVEKAVTECIREGILADFLRRNRAEVVKVSIFEYDREEEEKKIRKAEYEYGLEQGLERGRTEGLERGRTEGLEQGIAMMIRNLSVLKIPMEQIVQASGMEEAEVRKCLAEG